nr:ribonuclease H-like domain-containing protein [Tanacetum cinerariifolium]
VAIASAQKNRGTLAALSIIRAASTSGREGSHRGISLTFVEINMPRASAFLSRTSDNKRSNTGNWNNNNLNTGNKGNYNSLLCKNYGLKGHRVNRCFEIIDYPPGFKRNPNLKPNSNSNNRINNVDVRGNFMVNSDIKTSTGTMYFTNDQFMKLMILLNEKSNSSTHANIAGFGKGDCSGD